LLYPFRMMDTFNIVDPAFLHDPFAAYDVMRERAPVYWFEPGKLWFLTRHDHVARVFTDTLRFTSRRTLALIGSQVPPEEIPKYEPLARALSGWMILQDPPEHTRSRAMVAKAFTPKAMEGLRRSVEEIAQGLLDGALTAGAGAVFDVVRDYGSRLPIAVIARMLGVPESDWASLQAWTDEVAPFIGLAGGAETVDRGMRGSLAICAYFEALAKERRAAPREDMLSHLVAIAADPGAPSTDEEVASACFHLLTAGHETTETLIAAAAHLLLSHPGERAKLAANPSLLKTAIEEALRYDPSLYTQMRITTAEVDLDGHRIGAGQVVLLAIAAANRDPSVFPDPHRFDVTRQDNRHLSLGAGPHFCLGAALARMEAQIAIDALFRRAPGLELAGEGPTWKPPNLMFRQLAALPVRA
jgi:cytochrome P450